MKKLLHNKMKMLTRHSLMPVVMLLCSMMAACQSGDADEDTAEVPFQINLILPMDIEGAVLVTANVVVTNVETMKEYVVSDFSRSGDGYTATLALPVGTYNVAAAGEVAQEVNGHMVKTTLKAETYGVVAKEDNAANSSVRMLFSNFHPDDGLVIEEVFFTSNTYPNTQRPYTDDQYIIITNNSDHLIYADSVAIVESQFQPDMKWDLTPDLMRDAISVAWVYLIPGNGTDVPVEPGGSLLLALNAKDHTKINPNSFDLSVADFEFYDISPNTEFVDEDNPGTPNLIKWYSDMWSYTVLHNKGSKSYALVDMQVDMEQFLQEHFYHYTYTVVASWGTYGSKGDTYFIPNSWVIDAVNISIKSDWAWNVFSPALDSGWTYCAETLSDKTRYGLSVIRRRGADGKLIDTNNSTNDFLPRQTPSLKNK